MAIEKVYLHNNTSIIQDEVMHCSEPLPAHFYSPPLPPQVLAHRLGLIPLKVDPRKFQMLPLCRLDNTDPLLSFLHLPPPSLPPSLTVNEGDSFPSPSPEYSKHLLEFHLKVKCTRNPKAPKGSQDSNELYLHSRGIGECESIFPM